MDVSNNPTGTYRDCGLRDVRGHRAHMRLEEPIRPNSTI